MALLLPSGTEAVAEDGEVLSLERWPPGTRLWAEWALVRQLVNAGVGEAKCWRGDEVRWRHRRFEDGWNDRASDAAVLKLPLSHLSPERVLEGFTRWRDWLAGWGATVGTTGAAAMSLLKATLELPLVTSSGERPPIGFTLGGRQELGAVGAGTHQGRLVHLDLPAAYAATLSGLRYGGVWVRCDGTPGRNAEEAAGGEYPVFVRARVTIPAGIAGPLVKRPVRGPKSYLESQLTAAFYPSGCRLQGTWTWEELRAAELAGCHVTVLDAWLHRSGYRPFARWWEAVEQGRGMGGLAGLLAKVTGNALWGRFCMDPRAGRRWVRGTDKRGRATLRPLEGRRGGFPAHDLAETVSGRVRAQLYSAMREAGPDLLLADTDGLWCRRGSVRVAGWRVKGRAERLDVLMPQVYREWPLHGDGGPYVTFAGVPAELAAAAFENRWIEEGYSYVT